MAATEMSLMDEPERLRVALTPIRRQLLARLREPASAVQLAAELGQPRQRVGYHLKVLEQEELIELVEERRRRGCVERVMRATAKAFLVDPAVLTPTAPTPAAPTPAALTPAGVDAGFTRIADRHAAEHLVEVAAGTVREVTRMAAEADRQGVRLLTFTLEADVRFAEPGDVHRFTDELAEAVSRLAARYDTPGGRPYRLTAGGHPAPRAEPAG
ncbi:ArsR/SmtB family transcription factor [Nonomuraea wenchangensis]|uniref:Helix-turn-helix domain-containing protein n=1 Tax=Nonomuraea wenchangensis TaxID=568860 RepID=A0A1I0K9D6_9ACTN|nr:winged helix-turn-helix domain-containing protein [Nonomuraea wenchangensis]SEU20436.1 Helix-turn-helix domain-containing protein [Nonomuraea wenchangensis]